MSASAKVSEQEIRSALRCWRGNVAQTAHTLGISENALRKRLTGLGIGQQALSFLRLQGTHNHPHPTTEPTTQQTQPRTQNLQHKKEAHNYPRRFDAPKFEPMETAAEDPSTSRRAQPKPPKLRPDQVDQLRDAKFDFMAKHRHEADEGDILQKFFDENFPGWIKRALAPEKAKEKA